MLPITHPRPLPRARHLYEFGVIEITKRNGGKTESSVFSAFEVYYRQLGVEIFPG